MLLSWRFLFKEHKTKPITILSSASERWSALEEAITWSLMGDKAIVLAADENNDWFPAEIAEDLGRHIKVHFLNFGVGYDRVIEIYGGRVRPIFPKRSQMQAFWDQIETGQEVDYVFKDLVDDVHVAWKKGRGIVLASEPSEWVLKPYERPWVKHIVRNVQFILPFGTICPLAKFTPECFPSRTKDARTGGIN